MIVGSMRGAILCDSKDVRLTLLLEVKGPIVLPILARSSATAEVAGNANDVQGHSRSSVVVPIDVAYMTMLALYSSLTSIFNRS